MPSQGLRAAPIGCAQRVMAKLLKSWRSSTMKTWTGGTTNGRMSSILPLKAILSGSRMAHAKRSEQAGQVVVMATRATTKAKEFACVRGLQNWLVRISPGAAWWSLHGNRHRHTGDIDTETRRDTIKRLGIRSDGHARNHIDEKPHRRNHSNFSEKRIPRKDVW